MVSNTELLELETDVLVPAALENQIISENAERIKTRLIIELANSPVTAEADAILAGKNIPVIPDILANAGGVTVSYFEWVQNREGYYWEEAEVNAKLQKIILQALREVYEIKQKHQTTWRVAAYISAMQRVYTAMQLRGKFLLPF